MVRVAYGVCGEGMGHATRSSVVIEYLRSRGHDVSIVAGSRAYDYIAARGGQVSRIKGFHLVYEGDRLRNLTSLLQVVQTLPHGLGASLQTLARVLYDFRPQVIISDFEFFTASAGKALGIPVISANNISILRRARVGRPGRGVPHARWLALLTEMISTLHADYYVIPTFFHPPAKRRNVILTDPPVRKVIRNAAPSTGKHVLVYQTSQTNRALLDALTKVDGRFVVYGFGKRRKRKNLAFHAFNEQAFVKDLAAAKAVITGGGFSLLSEALALHKPVFCVPLRNHHEQLTNAMMLQELRFGECHEKPTAQDVEDFLLKLPLFRKYLTAYRPDPDAFARTIERLVRRCARAPDERKLRVLRRLFSRGEGFASPKTT